MQHMTFYNAKGHVLQIRLVHVKYNLHLTESGITSFTHQKNGKGPL